MLRESLNGQISAQGQRHEPRVAGLTVSKYGVRSDRENRRLGGAIMDQDAASLELGGTEPILRIADDPFEGGSIVTRVRFRHAENIKVVCWSRPDQSR